MCGAKLLLTPSGAVTRVIFQPQMDDTASCTISDLGRISLQNDHMGSYLEFTLRTKLYSWRQEYIRGVVVP